MKGSDYVLIAGGVAIVAVGIWSITAGPLTEVFDFFKLGGGATPEAIIAEDPTPTTAAAPAPEIKAMYGGYYRGRRRW